MPVVNKQKPVPLKKTGSKIENLITDVEVNDEIKMLLYGKSKTGKTTLWGSADVGAPGPILAILCSGGNKVGELKSLSKKDVARIKQLPLTESTLLKDAIELQKTTGRFKTIVLDHVTGLQDLILKEILGLDELPTQKSWGMASQQQYGTCTQQCKEYLRGLLNLDCNVIIVAQEREFNSGDDGGELLMPYVGAALTPSLVGWLNPAVDYIVNTFIRQKTETTNVKTGSGTVPITKKVKGAEYCLRVGPDPVYTTGFRVPKGSVLPEYLVSPTFQKVLKLTRGEKVD